MDISAIRVLDAWVPYALAPLCVWALISGLDDLFIFVAWTSSYFRRREPAPSDAQLESLPQKKTAIFLPLWREHAVIRDMIEHNLAALRYTNFDIFAGVYSNDPQTVEAVRSIERQFPNVHLAPVPHDGPTSKADCLNWICQYMFLDEDRRGVRYDVVLTHDAEDLIHPMALHWVNHYADRYDMVQVPVLPLPTPWHNLTHGVYCDEFAENQARDICVRGLLGGFLPSSGVGTGLTRRALDALAAGGENRIFDPGCLTEDYELGYRIHQLGLRQILLPIRLRRGDAVVTREYFPRNLAGAIRQRTRWVTGVVFQGWERHGWRGGWRQLYWHWRDRKGLIGAPMSLLANLLFLYCLASFLVSRAAGLPWRLPYDAAGGAASWLLPAISALQIVYFTSKIACTGMCYDPWRAITAPLRMPWSNLINAVACCRATAFYVTARLRKQSPAWIKTEHAYPTRAALLAHRPPLGEVLVQNHYLSAAQLEDALASQPFGRRLGDHLLDLGILGEQELYEALSLQQSLPLLDLEPAEIVPAAARALPAFLMRDWEVLPFRIADGSLYVARPEPPDEDLERQLALHTRLSIRFRLVTRSNFDRLRAEWIDR